MKINTTTTVTINGKMGYLRLTDDGYGIRIEAGFEDEREPQKGCMDIDRKDIQQVIDALQVILNKINKG